MTLNIGEKNQFKNFYYSIEIPRRISIHCLLDKDQIRAVVSHEPLNNKSVFGT